jgi:hypothetical protein
MEGGGCFSRQAERGAQDKSCGVSGVVTSQPIDCQRLNMTLTGSDDCDNGQVLTNTRTMSHKSFAATRNAAPPPLPPSMNPSAPPPLRPHPHPQPLSFVSVTYPWHQVVVRSLGHEDDHVIGPDHEGS